MRKSVIFLLSAVLLLALSSASVYAQTDEQTEEAQEGKKVLTLGNVTVMGSYSKIAGSDGLSGVYTSSTFAPVVKLDANNYLIPLYSGLYKQQDQIVNEEEGGQLYTRIMNHNLSLMHKHLYSEGLTQRLTAFATLSYNKETSDESFGDGLYDYYDFGGFADYQYTILETETSKGVLLFGGKYFFRKYPNFTSLIALALPTAPERDEKDQHVFGPTMRYTHRFADKLILSLSYDYLHKRFTDKLTVDENGILVPDDKREDNVHYFKLGSSYKLTEDFSFGLDGEIELNNSNMSFYDSLNTPLALGDDIYVSHYYDYDRYQVKPSITYSFPFRDDKKITCKLAYSYTFRDYPSRNIRNAAGDYLADTQEDNIHAGILNISVPITKKLSFLFMGDYSHNLSNMDYERFYRYQYDIYHLLSGLSYRF